VAPNERWQEMDEQPSEQTGNELDTCYCPSCERLTNRHAKLPAAAHAANNAHQHEKTLYTKNSTCQSRQKRKPRHRQTPKNKIQNIAWEANGKRNWPPKLMNNIQETQTAEPITSRDASLMLFDVADGRRLVGICESIHRTISLTTNCFSGSWNKS